jgi:hypothetical protein
VARLHHCPAAAQVKSTSSSSSSRRQGVRLQARCVLCKSSRTVACTAAQACRPYI